MSCAAPGYNVRVLEYQNRSGGRNISLRGGDSLTELGGYTQKCEFAPGNYINPGPWAHSVSPQCPAALLSRARRHPRTLHRGEPQRLSAQLHHLRRRPAALPPDHGRFHRPHRRAALQGHQPENARRADQRRRKARPAAGHARLGPSRQGLQIRWHGRLAPPRLRKNPRAVVPTVRPSLHKSFPAPR